jgi:hypothetical protein
MYQTQEWAFKAIVILNWLKVTAFVFGMMAYPWAPEALWSGGGSHFKRALASQPSFFWAAIFVKILLYGYPIILVAIVGRQTSTLILNNFICCTMLRAQNKISKRTYIAWFSIKLIRGRGTGGQWRHVHTHIFKSEKMPFGGLERKCPFCSSKDSVKAISFRSACERHKIVWFWS